jgi:hypothetical protein
MRCGRDTGFILMGIACWWCEVGAQSEPQRVSEKTRRKARGKVAWLDRRVGLALVATEGMVEAGSGQYLRLRRLSASAQDDGFSG